MAHKASGLSGKIIVRCDGFVMSESSGTVATFTVHAEFEGATHRFSCRADQSVLQAAEAAGVMLPSSCCSGVCTTCATVISEGEVDQPDAMGVKTDLQDKGYALLCVAFPRADLTLKAGQEDALYEAQFGQYQK